jgi:hypothetical protein
MNKEGWISEAIKREEEAHLNFFGRKFSLSSFKEKLKKYDINQIKEWQNIGLEPHFLPRTLMMADNNYPGWKVKPEQWFYNQVIDGKLFRNIKGGLKRILTIGLDGDTVLIDTRLKPEYNDGKQMWNNDNLLGQIITSLRSSGDIDKYEHVPQSSRFGVSSNEWEKSIKPAVAIKLGLNIEQIRLETTVERNAIPQIYSHMPRKGDGLTSTWVWVEEYFEGSGHRLLGGYSGKDGLMYVFRYGVGHHWRNGSFRPLVVV